MRVAEANFLSIHRWMEEIPPPKTWKLLEPRAPLLICQLQSTFDKVHLLLLLCGRAFRLDVSACKPALVHAAFVLVHPFAIEDLEGVGVSSRRTGVKALRLHSFEPCRSSS